MHSAGHEHKHTCVCLTHLWICLLPDHIAPHVIGLEGSTVQMAFCVKSSHIMIMMTMLLLLLTVGGSSNRPNYVHICDI